MSAPGMATFGMVRRNTRESHGQSQFARAGSREGSCPQRSPRRPEREHRDLRWNPQAQGECERAQTAIHIQEGGWWRARRNFIGCGVPLGAERQAVQARHERRDEAGRAPLAVPKREAYLTAMRMAREAKLDAQCRGPRKRIGVMGEQDVGDVSSDQ